ncbi:MAG: hypothetical protein R2854_00340 [Caldilineaceae bacterium]
MKASTAAAATTLDAVRQAIDDAGVGDAISPSTCCRWRWMIPPTSARPTGGGEIAGLH